jgi:hypothetical protein
MNGTLLAGLFKQREGAVSFTQLRVCFSRFKNSALARDFFQFSSSAPVISGVSNRCGAQRGRTVYGTSAEILF